MKIRPKKTTIEGLEELAELLDTTNKTECLERAVVIACIVGKLSKDSQSPRACVDIYNYLLSLSSMYISSNILDIYNLLDIYIYKKQEKKIEIPNKKEQSYQQSVILHDKVKDVLPYGKLFEATWILWRNYLRDQHSMHLTRTVELAQLKELNDLNDEQTAIKTINASIKNGYKGLFPDKQRKKTGTTFDADKARTAFDRGFGFDTGEST